MKKTSVSCPLIEKGLMMMKLFTKIVTFLLLLLVVVTPQSTQAAQMIESGNTISDTIAKGTSKWYSFTSVKDGADVYIYLSNEDKAVRFNLYDSSNKYIRGNSKKLFTTLKAGTYSIEVISDSYNNPQSSNSYDLTVTYDDGKNEFNSTTLEPNDTRENAYPLTSGKKISSSLSDISDIDFFKFTNHTDNGDVYIYLSNTSAPVRFNLFDSQKNLISSYNSQYFKGLKKGTYYIEVHSSGWGDKFSKGNYDLMATFSTPSVKHNAQTLEPNDTRENAFPLTSGKSIHSNLASPLDKDFFKVELKKQGQLHLQLTQGSAPTRFTVYDSNKNAIAYTSTAMNTSLKAGTYYIEIKPYNWGNSYSTATYSLVASFSNGQVTKQNILLTMNSKIVKVNGTNRTLPAAPYMKKGTTLVPIRLISEQLGAEVQWKSADQSIRIVLDGTVIQMKIGDPKVTVNGKRQTLSLAPEMKNGTTFVPVRFISEQYGRYVEWNAKKQTVLIQ